MTNSTQVEWVEIRFVKAKSLDLRTLAKDEEARCDMKRGGWSIRRIKTAEPEAQD